MPHPLSSAEAPAGYPNKNSNNEKIESARGTREEGKGGKTPVFSLPLPIVPPALSFSFSPASLRHKKASAEERVGSLRGEYS